MPVLESTITIKGVRGNSTKRKFPAHTEKIWNVKGSTHRRDSHVILVDGKYYIRNTSRDIWKDLAQGGETPVATEDNLKRLWDLVWPWRELKPEPVLQMRNRFEMVVEDL